MPLPIIPTYIQQSPIWTIAHQDLADALTDHWESLNPESQSIFKNLAMLPQLSAKDIQLPYKSPTNETQFVAEDIPVDAPQLPANTRIRRSPVDVTHSGHSNVSYHVRVYAFS